MWEKALQAYRSGDLNGANRACEQVLEARPKDLEALNLAGAIALQRGNPQAAADFFDRALAIDPRLPSALGNRAIALRRLGRWHEALRCYEALHALQPTNVDVLNSLGNVLQQLGRWDEALQRYQDAIALRPEFADAFSNAGIVLRRLCRHEDALAAFDRALELCPSHEDARFNRTVALRAAGKPESALETLLRIPPSHPRYAESLNAWGVCLHDLGRWDEARGCYEQALAIRPDYAEANWNLALLALARGDYSQGWALFEWRWKLPGTATTPRHFRRPLWLGESDIAGKTLLIHAEQGLGDTIQFARYIPLILSLRAKVVLECPAPLARLLSCMDGTHVVTNGSPLPAFDHHCPLGSLPLALSSRSPQMPLRFPYLSAPESARRNWRARLGKSDRPRIGIAWSGNPANEFDRIRSIELARLAPLLDRRFEWHALQKELRASDLDAAHELPWLIRWCDSLRDLAETAALVQSLDLIITIDSVVAHLCSALSKPTWVMLPTITDYRWPVGKDRSPWYPDARLFRQPRPADWKAVVASVRGALDEHFANTN